MFNISHRRVGALHFLKVGRFTASWSIAKRYKAVKPCMSRVRVDPPMLRVARMDRSTYAALLRSR